MGSEADVLETQSGGFETDISSFPPCTVYSASDGNMGPRAVYPDHRIKESGEPSPPGLLALSPLSCLDCPTSPYDMYDPIYVCMSSSMEQGDLRISYRAEDSSKGEEDSLFSEELNEAYSQGTLHSFFWKMMVAGEEVSTLPFEWKGHRPLDPAYPLKPTRLRRRLIPHTPPIPILQQTSIHPSSADIEVVLPRVCCDFAVFSIVVS